MRARLTELLNTPEIEIWPAALLRARSNRDARVLALAERVLRRKADGRYLAAIRGGTLDALIPGLRREPGLAEALQMLRANGFRGRTLRGGSQPPSPSRLAFELPAGYSEDRDLPLVPEPQRLHLAGFDRYRRPLWLLPAAARAWQQMLHRAAAEEIALQAISGYRSTYYQRAIFERKIARGQNLTQILAVNAAPGYSEHHSGRALDISALGEPAAEPEFENSTAFRWLQAHAGDFGFRLSYPRGNRHGVMYEPWHWCWQPEE